MIKTNNCVTCAHKQRPDGGHCYMFRMEPSEPCMQHTEPSQKAAAIRMQHGIQTMKRMGLK